MIARLAIPGLTFRLESGTLDWIDNQTGRRLIRVPGLELFAPVLDGQRAKLAFSRVDEGDANRLDLVQEDPATPAGPPSPDYFALLRRELPFQRLT